MKSREHLQRYNDVPESNFVATIMRHQIDIVMMSGVEDGGIHSFEIRDLRGIKISIGRDDDNDISVKTDASISRHHAILEWREGCWWLIDCDSKNGTFTEHYSTLQRDVEVRGAVQIGSGQLFRVGKTWMRFQSYKWQEDHDE